MHKQYIIEYLPVGTTYSKSISASWTRQWFFYKRYTTLKQANDALDRLRKRDMVTKRIYKCNNQTYIRWHGRLYRLQPTIKYYL